MSISITQVKADMSADLHGTTTNQITNLYGLMFRAASQVMSDMDLAETRRTVPIASTVYGQAYDYSCPSDVKGDNIIDVRPYSGRSFSDPIRQAFSADFDRQKGLNATGVAFEVRHDTAVKTLRLSVPSVQTLSIDGTSEVWTNGGLATVPVVDNFNTAQGNSSLKYDLTGDGWLERSDLSFDLSGFTETAVFVWVWLASVLPTGHTIFIGSDSSNYKSVSVTSAFDGTAYREGWNLIGFELDDATVVGTPDMANGTYVRVATSITGTATDTRICSVTAAQGKLMEVEYYSKFLFRSASGAFKERPTLDSDLLNLDSETYALFYPKLLELTHRQIGSEINESATFAADYLDKLKKRRRLTPSQSKRPQTSYYTVKRSRR